MKLINGEDASNYLMKHYEDLLDLVNNGNNGNNGLYSDLELETIERLLFEKIVVKINNLEKLSLNEAYLFVSRLVRYAANALDIRIPCNFSIVESDDNRLPSDSLGVFRNDNNHNFEILYSKEILKYLCGLEKIDYEEGSDWYIQTMIISIIFSLISFPHELVHAKQFEERYMGDINLRNFLLTLEHILCKGKYYALNAPFVYEECYADVRAVDLLFEFLRKYNILNDSDVFDAVYNLMKKEYDQHMLKMKEYLVVEDGNTTGIVTDCYLLFGVSKYIKENPKFLNSFPLLKLVFSETGDLLTIDSILEKCMIMKKEVYKTDVFDKNDIDDLVLEIDKIYSFILKSYCFIYGRDKINDEIKLYLDNVMVDDEFVSGMLDMCNKLECIEVNKLNSNIKKRILEMRKL